MLLLIAFGFVAGAGTALSPCVLPVLPVVLAAGASGGRRRPLGIVAGLVASFTFSTVALADSTARRAGRGLRQPLRRWPAGQAGRRGVLVGNRRGGEPRARLRTMRRADPCRGYHG